jgi:hypothetical protein
MPRIAAGLPMKSGLTAGLTGHRLNGLNALAPIGAGLRLHLSR